MSGASLCVHGKTILACKDRWCHSRFVQIVAVPAVDQTHDRTLYALDQHGLVYVYDGDGWEQLANDAARAMNEPQRHA